MRDITSISSNKQPNNLRILLVEDSEHDIVAFQRALQKGKVDCDITRYVRAEDALTHISVDAADFDLIVTDYKLPGMSGLDFCKELVAREIPFRIVILSGTGSDGLAVEALKIGIDDYLIKNPDLGYLDQLPIILLDAVRKHTSRQASKRPDEGFVRSEAHYPIVIEDQKEFIRCFTLGGKLSYVNDAYSRYLNKRPEQLIGQDFLEFVHVEDKEKVKEHISSLNKDNALNTIECRVEKNDGKTYYQQWTDRAIFNGNGTIIEFQSIGHDISDKKRAIETLIQSQERYRSIIELIPNSFFICDTTSGDFLLIKYTIP